MSESQYIQLITDILEKGSMEPGRNGLTKSLFGYSMRLQQLHDLLTNINI